MQETGIEIEMTGDKDYTETSALPRLVPSNSKQQETRTLKREGVMTYIWPES